MPITLLFTFGPAALGLLLAAVRRIVRPNSPLPKTVRFWTLAAMGIALVLTLLTLLANLMWYLPGEIPPEVSRWMNETRHLHPLVIGLLVLALLSLPHPSRARHGHAELSPRDAFSFTARWWFVASGIVLAVIIAVTLATGLASERDAAGRYTVFSLPFGEVTASTRIYGWYYSIPALVLLAALVIVTLLVLRSLARAPFGADRERDAAVRRTRSGNVVAAATGAMLLHAEAVFHSVAGTSMLGVSLDAGTHGRLETGTSFAALTPTLWALSLASAALGFALWFLVLLTAASTRARTLRAPIPA